MEARWITRWEFILKRQLSDSKIDSGYSRQDYPSSVSESGSSVVGRSKSLGKPFFGKRTDSATSDDNYCGEEGGSFCDGPSSFLSWVLFCRFGVSADMRKSLVWQGFNVVL